MVKIKYFTAGLLCGALVAGGVVLADRQLSIFVNGNMIDASNAYISGDRTYIPLRAVAEALGADVIWNSEDYSISITSKSITKAKLEENEILKNPMEHQEEFETVLDIISDAWDDNTLNDVNFEKLSGNIKTTVEQILLYKYEFENIPQIMNSAFSKYWTDDKADTALSKKLNDVFYIEKGDSGYYLSEKN